MRKNANSAKMVKANARTMRPAIVVSLDEYEELMEEKKRDYANARYARIKAKRDAKRAYGLARYYRLKAEREAEREIENARIEAKRAYGRNRYYRMKALARIGAAVLVRAGKQVTKRAKKTA